MSGEASQLAGAIQHVAMALTLTTLLLLCLCCRAGWQVAMRVAADEQCSSEASRRSLLAFAMRHAPAEQLAGLLGNWQAIDASAAGLLHLWASPEELQAVRGGMLRPARAAIAHYFSKGSRQECADDAPAVLASLLALGSDADELWEQLLQQSKAGMGYCKMRQAYLIGITACALGVSAHCPSVLLC